jgi:hypothetical protein
VLGVLALALRACSSSDLRVIRKRESSYRIVFTGDRGFQQYLGSADELI